MRLGVLAERNFALLFLGQATSAFGDRLAPIALAFAVLDLTGSASDLGFVLAAQTLPTLLLVAVAGVWADRLPRQLVMLSSDAIRCGSQGATAALLLLHQARIWELVVLQAVYGAAEAFFTPAMTGLIPATAGPGRLREANALMSLSRSAVGVGGPAVGGVLVAFLSSGIALAGDAATFVISAASLALLRLERPPRPAAATSVLTELREGLAEVRTRTWLWAMILYFGVFNILVFPPFLVLGPYVAKHSLGGPGAWAAILTGGSAGFVAGSLLAIRVGASRPLFWGEIACGLSALPSLFLGLGLPVATIVAVTFVRAIGLSWGDALWHTTMQQRVPERALSRVSALDWTGTLALNPLGFALVGPLARGNRGTGDARQLRSSDGARHAGGARCPEHPEPAGRAGTRAGYARADDRAIKLSPARRPTDGKSASGIARTAGSIGARLSREGGAVSAASHTFFDLRARAPTAGARTRP